MVSGGMHNYLDYYFLIYSAYLGWLYVLPQVIMHL